MRKKLNKTGTLKLKTGASSILILKTGSNLEFSILSVDTSANCLFATLLYSRLNEVSFNDNLLLNLKLFLEYKVSRKTKLPVKLRSNFILCLADMTTSFLFFILSYISVVPISKPPNE